jgi:AcrR family transcriptional regulator
MAEQAGPAARPDLLAIAFALIAERGLRGFGLMAVATRAGVSPVEVYRELPGRRALLGALSRRVDEAMLAIDQMELVGLPPRDRVFELIMRRLDALAPFRDGLVRIEGDLRREPLLGLLHGCRLDRSLRWLQDVAGLPSTGLRARARRGLIGVVYLRTLAVWLEDDTTELARTMAELDKGLRRIEALAGLSEGPSRAPLDQDPGPADLSGAAT